MGGWGSELSEGRAGSTMPLPSPLSLPLAQPPRRAHAPNVVVIRNGSAMYFSHTSGVATTAPAAATPPPNALPMAMMSGATPECWHAHRWRPQRPMPCSSGGRGTMGEPGGG
jgi:hypothetical protein